MDGTPPARVDRHVGSAAPAVRVEHDRTAHRFVAERDGGLIGFLEYALLGRKMLLTHTEVRPDERGQGVGDALVRAAVAHIRADDLVLRPLCGFVADWLGRHPEHTDLVDPVDRDRLMAPATGGWNRTR